MGEIDEEKATSFGEEDDNNADEERAFLPEHDTATETSASTTSKLDKWYILSVVINIGAAVGLVRKC